MKLTTFTALAALALSPAEAALARMTVPKVVIDSEPFNFTMTFTKPVNYEQRVEAVMLGALVNNPAPNKVGVVSQILHDPAAALRSTGNSGDVNQEMSFVRFGDMIRFRAGILGSAFAGYSYFEYWEANITVGDAVSSERIELTRIYNSNEKCTE